MAEARFCAANPWICVYFMYWKCALYVCNIIAPAMREHSSSGGQVFSTRLMISNWPLLAFQSTGSAWFESRETQKRCRRARDSRVYVRKDVGFFCMMRCRLNHKLRYSLMRTNWDDPRLWVKHAQRWIESIKLEVEKRIICAWILS